MGVAGPDWRPALVAGLRARLGPGSAACRLVGVDGWSGSGKTSLADWLAPALGAPCVHVDDLVPGWDGMAASIDLLGRQVLEPLAGGHAARWRRWDWTAGKWGQTVEQPPVPIVVVEGCGAGAAGARRWLSALVWLRVAPAERSRRLRARDDWAIYEPWVATWAAQERTLRAGDDPGPHADVIVDDDHNAPRLLWKGAPV